MNPAGAIALSGAVAGVADLAATGTIAKGQGIEFERLLQFIGSGILGKSSFSGGKRTAVTGFLLHFLIAFFAAAAYYALSRDFPVVQRSAVLSGIGYGTAVHLFMSRIVVPLSRTPPRPFAMKQFLIQLAIHICCVGWPIAFVQAWLAH
jgi:uncharacterized membrane protein YagU involved in acid resistance